MPDRAGTSASHEEFHPRPLSVEVVRACFPWPVGVGLRRVEDGRPAELFPEEQAALSPRAVAKRRLHFTLGRAAARDALEVLGVQPVAVLRGANGEPVWPDGVVGAITHTQETAIAVVGTRDTCAGIGVDLEPLSPGLGRGPAGLVCMEEELAWTEAAEDDPTRTARRTMLFCAKEAVFKALFPIERVWLGFHDAELTWRPEDGAFEALLRKAAGASYGVGYRLTVTCRSAGSRAGDAHDPDDAGILVLATTYVPRCEEEDVGS